MLTELLNKFKFKLFTHIFKKEIMVKEFKEPVFKSRSINFYESHLEYFEASDIDNLSFFVRWMFDNHPAYIKYMKEKDE